MEFYILPGTKVKTKHKTFTRIKDSDRILLTDLFYTYEESEVEEVSYPEDQEYCIADNKVLVPKKWVRGKEFHCLKSPARMFIDGLDEEARNYVGEHLDKSDSGEPILFFDKNESNKISKVVEILKLYNITVFPDLSKGIIYLPESSPCYLNGWLSYQNDEAVIDWTMKGVYSEWFKTVLPNNEVIEKLYETGEIQYGTPTMSSLTSLECKDESQFDVNYMKSQKVYKVSFGENRYLDFGSFML